MYYVGVDVGGTFTDCVILDETGRVVALEKGLSTQEDPSQGVVNVLGVCAEALGLSLKALLRGTSVLVHGTTVATNAMLERKGVRTGLLTSRGHEDTIVIGRVYQKRAGLPIREILHESHLHKAEPPIVDQATIRGVTERIDYRGQAVVPLDEAELLEKAEELVRAGCQAIALAFLWSFLNSAHEDRARALIEQRWPGCFVTASHEVAPVLGEYERSVTAVLTAYLGPKVAQYIQRLERALKEEGFAGRLLLIHSAGGLTGIAEIARRPLLLLDSGPSGGALGARFFGRLYGQGSIICTDMGGTSFDVVVIRDGEITLDEKPTVSQYTFYQPKIQVSSIGAGGGSIIWLDADGILRVGPESAGSNPGPACYDRGGTLPTVTDANVLLGYLNPDYFLGGRMRLNRRGAQQALEPLARALQRTLEEVAAGAFKIVNTQMADLIRINTIEKGVDPRSSVLFAYGGAGPTHCAYYARELQVRAIYIPGQATAFSALGMLCSDLLHTREHSFASMLPMAPEVFGRLLETLTELEGAIRAEFEAEGIPAEQVSFARYAYMRYGLQVHELAVELPAALSLDVVRGGVLEHLFESKYEQVYGRDSGYREAGIEVVKLRVEGRFTGLVPRVDAESEPSEVVPGQALKGERAVYLEERGRFLSVPVYQGERLRYGNRLEGPCIVERKGDTVLVPTFARVYVDAFHNLRMDLPA